MHFIRYEMFGDESNRVRFSETSVVECGGALELVDRQGVALFRLTREEVEEAMHAGFLDPEDLHYTLYEYSRMIREIPVLPVRDREGRAHAADDHAAPIQADGDPGGEDAFRSETRGVTSEDRSWLHSIGIRWS